MKLSIVVKVNSPARLTWTSIAQRVFGRAQLPKLKEEYPGITLPRMAYRLTNNRPVPVREGHLADKLPNCLGRFRNRHHFRVPPQPFQIVVGPRLGRENVDQIIAIICQYPLRIVVAFHADRMLAALRELGTDLFADGLDLLWIRAAAHYKEIRERSDFAQVEHSNVDRFLRFGGPNCSEPRRGAKR